MNQKRTVTIGNDITITDETIATDSVAIPNSASLKSTVWELPDSPATEYYSGGAIKALKDLGEMGGYLVNWGSPNQRDSTGEWFTPNTEYRLDYYDTRPVLFHHGLAEADSVKIGEIYELSQDDKGIYARARLYLNDPNPEIRYWANRAWDEVKNNKMFWSSGSIAHLVEKTAQGEITKWPIVEGSLTPNPAEPVRTKVDALKHACSELFCTDDVPPRESATREDWTPEAQATDMKAIPQNPIIRTRKAIKMLDQAAIDALLEKGLSAEQVLAVIGTLGEAAAPEEAVMADDEPLPEDAPIMAAEEDDEEPFRSAKNKRVAGKADGKRAPAPKPDNTSAMLLMQMAEMRKEMKTMRTAPPVETVPGRSGRRETQFQHRIRNRYENMSAMDMAFLKSVMDAAVQIQGRGNSWTPDEEQGYYKSLALKTQDEKIAISEEASRTLAIKSGMAIKNDELNYSTQASYGDEFVPELWSSNLWRTPRLENPVFANSTVIEMPSNPYKLPIEGSDPTVYAVAETKNESALTLDSSSSPIPDSKIGTSNTTMTAAKLALRVMLAEELNEDSIIPVVQLWREQAVREMEDARDAVILSADASATTANINYDGSSATTSVAAVSRFLYGGGDGYLHVPLIDATSQAVNMGNVAPTLAKIREARGKLDRDIFQKRNELVYYCDPETLLKLESLDESIVTSINGVGSTFEGREVKAIDGIPVFPTAEMGLATTTGVVSATASNNTQGRLLLVHKPSWYVGFRREMRVTFDYLHHYDAHMLVVTMRMALVKRATDTVSLLYNIAV